ncbi:adenine phosphoribosyltransferase [Spiroplasma cantharicola]|uniref:Adenine phosphoribosyltransferase n=1 Tax=Spiroplasma cantharicola TaxID=362837 RepID=A0A0M3SJ80_9MOLU|nr:adenine phosphoribosyltransferase [Spiroplasma cantharicola]ALD66288.1 adenine phosphoribosyltransferase [Spiroplasma cantharicola]
MDINKYILDVHNFPIEGVTFKDITPLLNDKDAFKYVIDKMVEYVKEKKATVIVAPEARGFLLASAVAYAANCRFVLVRKPGKLPRKVKDVEYVLEYGKGHIQMHVGDLKENDNVVIVDDVLATGGTMKAIVELVNQEKAKVGGIVFLADLSFLHEPDLFKEFDSKSLITY